MTLPGGRETVGEAYIRLLADGSGMDRSIDETFRDHERTFEDYGDRDRKAYQKGFHGSEADRKKAREDVIKSVLPAKGEFDQVVKEYAGDFGKRLQAELEKAVGDKKLANRIFQNIKAEDLRATGFGADLHRATEQLKVELQREKALKDKALAEDIARGRADRLFNRQLLLDDLARRKSALREEERGEEELRRAGRAGGRKETDEAISNLQRLKHFVENTDFGKFFGQGNRNNFINSFGNLVGLVARGIALAFVEPLAGLEKVKRTLRDVRREGGSLADVFAALAARGIGGLVNGLGALSAGIVAVPLLLKGLLAGIQIFLGPIAALITDLAGVIAALSSTIGFGLVGAIAPLLPLIAPLAFGIAAVSLALYKVTKASKQTKAELLADIKPLRDEFKKLQTSVQDAFFGKGNINVKNLAVAAAPVLKLFSPLLAGTAGAIARSLIDFTRALGNKDGKAFLDAFAKFTPEAISKIGKAFSSAFLGLGGVMRNLVPFARELLDYLVKSSDRFEKFTNSDAGQKKMTKFFTGAVSSAKLLLAFLSNTGRVLGDILSAGKSTGDSLFGSINKSLETYDKFLRSTNGQQALARFFAQVKPFLGALGNFVGGFGKFFSALNNGQSQNILNGLLTGLGGLFLLIAKDIPSVIPLIHDFSNGVTAVLKVLGVAVNFVSEHRDIFGPIITSLGSLYIASKLVGASSLSSALGAIGRQVGLIGYALLTGTTGALTKVEALKGAVLGLGIATAGIIAGFHTAGAAGASFGIGGGIIGGALLGASVGGAPGALILGALGGIAGGVAHFWGNANRAADESKARQIADLNAIQAAADQLAGSISGVGRAYTDAARQQVIAALSVPNTKRGDTESDVALAQKLHIDTKDLADAVGGDAQAMQRILFQIQNAENTTTQQIVGLQRKIAADKQAILDENAKRTQEHRPTLTTNDPLYQQLRRDQDALEKLNGTYAEQKKRLNDFLADLGIQGAAVAKDIKLKDDQAAAIGKLSLATRDLASQVLTYGNTLDYSTTNGQRNLQFIRDHAKAIASSKVVQDALKKSTELGAQAFISQTKALQDNLVQAGFAPSKVASIIAEYDKIPPGVKTQLLLDYKHLPADVQAVLRELGIIPPSRSTTVKADNQTAAGLAAAAGAIKRFADQTHDIYVKIIPVISNALLVNQINNIRNELRDAGLRPTAVGGVFFGRQVRTIAEAGAEAVVPLHRPLSQVDPSVRALSAYAQGIPDNSAPSNKMNTFSAGGGPIINIHEGGALFATSTTDPRAVVDELWARVIAGGYS